MPFIAQHVKPTEWAIRIKRRVKRASFASETLGSQHDNRKPTECALGSLGANARFRSPASRVPFLTMASPGFRCVPRYASALRSTVRFIRDARIRGLTSTKLGDRRI